MKIVDQIPDEIIHQLKTVQHIPKENELNGITKEGGTRVYYGYYTMTLADRELRKFGWTHSIISTTRCSGTYRSPLSTRY